MKMRKTKQIGGWIKTEDAEMVDIIPRGEEDRHIADEGCECGPRRSQSDDRRVMIIHRSYDGRDGFELAGESEIYQRRAA